MEHTNYKLIKQSYSRYILDQATFIITSLFGSKPSQKKSIGRYLRHILHRSNTNSSTFFISLYYLCELKKKINMDPVLIQNSFCEKNLFLVCLILASKIDKDHSPKNVEWAHLSGLELTVVNKLEYFILCTLDYNLHIKKKDYDAWSSLLHCPLDLSLIFT